MQRYLSEQYTERAAGEHADDDADADAADVGAARPGRAQRAAPVLDSPTGGGSGGGGVTSTAAFALEAYVCMVRGGFVADRNSTVSGGCSRLP